MKVPLEFYTREDVVQISRELLGKILCTKINGQFTSVIITETEAYAGVSDKASHAYGGRRTKRTKRMPVSSSSSTNKQVATNVEYRYLDILLALKDILTGSFLSKITSLALRSQSSNLIL